MDFITYILNSDYLTTMLSHDMQIELTKYLIIVAVVLRSVAKHFKKMEAGLSELTEAIKKDAIANNKRFEFLESELSHMVDLPQRVSRLENAPKS